jgi:uncharacterized membrane protein
MDEQKQQQTPPAAPQQPQAGGGDVNANKAITYLSYIGLLFLVPMLAKRESKFAQFHAKQGLVLTIGWFVGSFLYMFMGLGVLVHLFILILSIIGLVNVSKGEMKNLPIVGGIAEKFNI